jgi:hypothetical protein
MEPIRAFIPWTFFPKLHPIINGESLDGNAMVIRACGASPKDGTLLQSPEYVLFRNGLATLVLQIKRLTRQGVKGYVMLFTQKQTRKQVSYWEVETDQNQEHTPWSLDVSDTHPDSDDGINYKILAEVQGDPGQYLFLSRLS